LCLQANFDSAPRGPKPPAFRATSGLSVLANPLERSVSDGCGAFLGAEFSVRQFGGPVGSAFKS
jgi:hypothetical protein